MAKHIATSDLVGGRKVRTENVYPPIPLRQFDWCAWLDGDEEAGPRGWGRTEQEAIAELMVELED